MKKLYIFIIAACCLTVGSGVSGHNFVRLAHAGKGKAEKVQAHKPEFQRLLTKAEKGDAESQFKVGVGYARGHDASIDKTKAAKWYEKAAKKGHPVAQNNLAAMYMKGKDKNGKGIEKDVKKGLDLYEKAAEQGSTSALNNLALHYITGIDVEKDVDKAIALYTKAADLGDEMATFILAMVYYRGEDLPKDDTKAAHWFAKAAKMGDKSAKGYLKDIKEAQKKPPKAEKPAKE